MRIIDVSYKNPGVKGVVCFSILGVPVVKLGAERVRKMYYGVLGIKMSGTSLVEHVSADVDGVCFSVDVPEDILRLERYLKGNK